MLATQTAERPAKQVQWGPNGEVVYNRSYRQVMPNGEFETWLEGTVPRVVDGNLGLVDPRYIEPGEREQLIDLIGDFKILPGGRHLSMSGKKGRQFLFNCHVAGWHKQDIARHFVFAFDQLMQGGGVGANYSSRFTSHYKRVRSRPQLHIVCSPEHADYKEMEPYLSTKYSHAWSGTTRVADSREGWCDALEETIHAFWAPEDEDIVLDMSLIRRRGERIRTFGGTSSGPSYLAKMLVNIHELLTERHGARLNPMDLMLIDHYIAECVVSGNVRRSARMSMCWWNDPHIFDFIMCKRQEGVHWSTNISVVVDDAFFQALRQRDEHAQKVYRMVVEGMLTNGEPGFYNYSLAMVGELGSVACTNPCGEITLEEWENCNLGHVNLDMWYDDFRGAENAFRLMTRFLMRATFGDVPSDAQREVMQRNRRIGVGFFGFHGWLTKQGIRFSDSHRNPYVRKTLKDFYDVCRKEARRYAFQMRIPEPIKVTTVAPTGTGSKMPGTTPSMEPEKFAYFELRVRFSPDDPELENVRQQGYPIEDALYEPNTSIAVFPAKSRLLQELENMFGSSQAEWLFEQAGDIALEDHLAVQAMVQEAWADNSISYTVNLRPDEIQQAFIEEHPDWAMQGLSLPLPSESILEGASTALRHFLPRLKGTTVMVDGSRQQAPYTEITRDRYFELISQYAPQVTDSADEDCASGACDWAGADAVSALVAGG